MMKRLLSAVLVAIMVLSLATVAFAAGTASVSGDTVYVYAGTETTVDVPITVTGEFANFNLVISSSLEITGFSGVTGNTATGMVAWATDENVASHTFTVQVKVPATAKVGDKFPVNVSVLFISDRNLVDQEIGNVSGGMVEVICNHEYDDGEVTTQPTCTETGVKTYTCEKCGETYTETVAALGHDYVGTVTKEATCTEDGEMTYTCSRCGDSYTEVIPSEEGHEWDDGVVTTEPTCTEPGVKTYTCSKCGATKTEEIPALGHDYTSAVTKPATCTEPGVKTYTCSECGHSYTEEIPATGHTWETEWSDDETHHWHECSACGEKKDHAEHDMVCVDRLSATAKKDGYELYECKVCGHQRKDVVPANPDLDDVPGTGDITDTVTFGMTAILVTMMSMVALVVKRKTAK